LVLFTDGICTFIDSVSINEETYALMVFNTPIDFIRFINEKEEILPNSPVLRNLEDKRRTSKNCCKCVRGQKVREFLDFYYSLGGSLSEGEKTLLKQVAGDSLTFKNDDNVFFEIK
jgi:hypothetical protein